MMEVFVLLLIAPVAYAAVQHPEEWQLWKSQHGKSYQSELEELERHLVWLANREYINGHNSNAHIFGYSLQLNQFADWTDEEFHQTYFTYNTGKHGGNAILHNPQSMDWKREDLPLFVDWRRVGAVTEVKEQVDDTHTTHTSLKYLKGHCGCSYAFSAVGAIEGAWALKHGHLVNISAQNIIDCSGDFGNRGCNGGNMDASFRYILSNKGVNNDTTYPYIARQSSCQFNGSSRVTRIKKTVVIARGNETHLQSALANVGPVSVAIDASTRSFRFYYRGVYRSQLCSSSVLNHALLAVGYGTLNQADYWLLKNSWGKYWGVDGYILLARNQSNHCGVATDASYPTVK